MNTTISILRILILLLLGLIAIVLIFNEEEDLTTIGFALHFVLDKAIGILCAFYFGQLYRKWARSDKLIARFEAWNAKSTER